MKISKHKILCASKNKSVASATKLDYSTPELKKASQSYSEHCNRQ